MGRTMAEKILTRASGDDHLRPGDVILAKLDLVSLTDGGEPIDDWIDRHGLKVWDPERVVFSFDHFYGESSKNAASIVHPRIRAFARRQGIPAENVHDVGRHGLSHQVPAEEGYVLPGTFYGARDTQGATMGALNCFAMPLRDSTVTSVVTGEVWLVVPESARVTLRGKLPRGVLGKDVYFRLLRDLPNGAQGRILEYAGPGVRSLSIDLRMAVANGSAHLGATTSIFPPDERLLEYVAPRARWPFDAVTADPDAAYAATYEYDLDEFEPLVSGPDEIREIRPLSAVAGTAVQAANIGSCSSGRYEDLALAAEVLEGRHIHPSVRMVVTPISSTVMRDAAANGLLAIFTAAGATVTSPGCGSCFAPLQSPLRLDDREVCISASVENYAGRMGSPTSRIYLGNAAVVAASAIEGQIASPSGYLRG